jgi:hypothetical protein
LDSSLVTASRRLPVRQREVIVLRLLLNLDTATTAQTLGIPSGTVASQGGFGHSVGPACHDVGVNIGSAAGRFLTLDVAPESVIS